MNPPRISPDSLCIQLQPGEARIATTLVTKIPPSAQMTVTLAGAEHLVRLRNVTVFEMIRRALTDEEIRELPPRPPSIRENARRNGVEERVDIGHHGSEPFAITSGQSVEITLEFSVPSQTLEGITAARLIVAGSSWTAVDVPVFCVVGRAVATPVVEPARIRCALTPGQSVQRSAVIVAAPTGDELIACVVDGRGLIRLQNLIAMREVRRPATAEEIAELPPFPPSIREDAISHGVVEHHEVARSDGVVPLTVAAGQTIYANLEFSAPAGGTSEIIDAALVIDSPRWQRTEIPLRLIVGSITVELDNSAVTVTQGKSVELVVSLFSQSGPGDLVHFSIEDDGDRLQVFPESLPIQPRKSTVGRLTLSAAIDAPIGVMPVVFVARVFEQMQAHIIPLRVEVQAGGIQVSTRPFTLTARQGETVTFDVTVFNEGGVKRVTTGPGRLPAGLQMESASFTAGPAAGAHVQPLRLVIDPDAPVTNKAWMPIAWSANDGTHSGIVNLPITIERRPDSRTFRQQITTPAGTALGGFAELEIRNDGNITFRGHMHGSGLDPYAFRIGYFLRATNLGLVLSDVFSSRVGGTLGGGPRDRDWNVTSHSPLLKAHWASFRDSQAEFHKWYEDTGVLDTLESLILPITEFLVVRVLAGAATAAVLVLGPALARIADFPVAVPPGIPGAVILGGVVFIFGPLAVVPAVVAGVAVAQAADIKTRRMHPAEIAEAVKVFGDTLPIDRIRVSNLTKRALNPFGESRPFCTANPADNTILIGMGEAFKREDLVGDHDFIHELTHAWQLEHRAFAPEDIWGDIERPFLSAQAEAELYGPFTDQRPWRDMHSEGQARTVESWYRIFREDEELARGNIWFPYIANNIRTGQG